MVNPQLVQDRCAKVVGVDPVFHHVIAIVVSFSVCRSAPKASARHPHAIRRAEVVAALAVDIINIALQEGGSAKFARPNDDRVFQQAPLFEVFDQCRRSLVCAVPELRLEFDFARLFALASDKYS